MTARKTDDTEVLAFDWIHLLKPGSYNPDKRYSWMTREQFELAARTFYALQATAQERARKKAAAK